MLAKSISIFCPATSPIFLRDSVAGDAHIRCVRRPSLKLSSRPSKWRLLLATGCRVVSFKRLPVKRLKSAALINLLVEPGRRNFQRVRSRHDIFDVENRAKFAAEVRAILMRHSGQRIGSGRGLSRNTRRLTATEKLDFYDFEPARGGNPSRISRTRSTSSAMNPVAYRLWQPTTDVHK